MFTKVGDLIGSTKTQFKNLKFGMVVKWPIFCLFVDMHNFFSSELTKGV